MRKNFLIELNQTMTSRLKNRELFIMGNVHSEAMRASLTNVDKGNSSLGGKVAQITLRDH